MTNVLESLIEEYTLEQTEKEMIQQDMNTNHSLITLLAQRE